MKEIRVRFAPSPTGPLHIGGARSALFNFLFAKNRGGKFILRIEDTDLERSSRESEKNIMESLKWLGIEWDEGPDRGGPFGPYRQMERLDIYRSYTEKLLKEGKAYFCYCSEEELEAERKAFFEKGELPRYGGRCARLSETEKKNFAQEGCKPTVRFRVPPGREIVVHDKVRGDVVFDSEGIGDFVIVKSDGIPTYNYAVVIDDALMQISHVIRAEEHLSNTPRQILLYKALGFEVPVFAHISLILGKDRSKMSKRHGATSVVQYRQLGYLPEAVANFLALMGWSPAGEEELFSLGELIKEFSLDRVAKSPAVFDMDKLRWLNGMYIRKIPVPRLAELIFPFLREKGYLPKTTEEKQKEWVAMVAAALQEKLETLEQVAEYMELFTTENVEIENDVALGMLKEDTFPGMIKAFLGKIEEMDKITPDDTKAMLKGLVKELKLNGRQVYMPLRIALTGQMHGPELHYLIPILGKVLVAKRISQTSRQAGVPVMIMQLEKGQSTDKGRYKDY